MRRERRAARRAMRMGWMGWAALVAWLATGAAAFGEEHDTAERVARDLLTVITMQGLPCGEVESAQRHSDQDYTVTCRSGDRYRVRIVEERVRIDRL